MDNWLVASIALVAFFAFGVISYVVSEERKSRKILSGDGEPGRDNVETRNRRAF